jgi:hypothetical protein
MNQCVRPNGDIGDPVPSQNSADEMINPIAEHGNGYVMFTERFQQAAEARIDGHTFQKSRELLFIDADQIEFFAQTFHRPNNSGLPAFFDQFPGVTDGKFLDEVVEHITARDRAVKVNPDLCCTGRGDRCGRMSVFASQAGSLHEKAGKICRLTRPARCLPLGIVARCVGQLSKKRKAIIGRRVR